MPTEAFDLDELEKQLTSAMRRVPAPPGWRARLNRRLYAGGGNRWISLATAAGLILSVTGGVLYNSHVNEQRGIEAREKLLTALRITEHSLAVASKVTNRSMEEPHE
jgi:hypothetical protein